MEKQINKSLLELEESLSGIKNWTELIKQSEKDNIAFLEEGRQQFKSSHLILKEVGRAFQYAAASFDENAQQIGLDTREMLSYYQGLSEATANLVEYLSSVNFPARLEKLEENLGEQNSTLSNIQEKMKTRQEDLIREGNKQRRQMVLQKNISTVIIVLLIIIIILQGIFLFY